MFIKQLVIRIRYSDGYNLLLNNYFLLVIGIVLFLLSYNHLLYLPFFCGYLYFLYKKINGFFIIVITINIVIFISLILLETKQDFQGDFFVGQITMIDNSSNFNRITVKNSQSKILVYDYDNRDLQIGMIVEVRGINKEIDVNRIEGAFNYKRYLKHQHFDGVLVLEEIDIINNKFHISRLSQIIRNHLESNYQDQSIMFLKAFILGDKSDFDDEFANSLKDNGIVHLFAISGLHVALFVGMISVILKYIDFKESSIQFIICWFLFFYIVITNFSPSILRASLMYYLAQLSKFLKLGFSSLDIVSIVFIVLIVYNPYFMYGIGFVLSFLVCFVILLSANIIQGKKPIYQVFIISCLAQISTFPIIINLNNQINILSVFTNVVYIFLVQMIVLPFTILLIVFPILQSVYNILIDGFVYTSLLLSDFFTIHIRFPSLNQYFIAVYYGIIIFFICFYNSQKLRKISMSCILLFLLALTNVNKLYIWGEINYLDLYFGESIIITEPFGRCNVVIDTGCGRNNEVSNFLKRKGIKELDLLIITHNHLDHNGEAMAIINNFTVNNIVVSAYDNSKVSNLPGVKRVYVGDILGCGYLEFEVLHPDKRYVNENDNSIVLYTEIGGLKYLFMGDVTENVEYKFHNIDVDVIKIGHHGSKTSSSNAFISSTRPRYAIIQTGRIERFGFPHQEVITILDYYDVEVYRTDEHYSIKYRYIKKKGIHTTLR